MRRIRGAMALAALLALCLGARADAPASPDTPAASAPRWVRADETVVPIHADISRNAVIRGFLRKGQVVAVERSTEHWVKVKANDTVEGWVPSASVAESGPPVHLDPGFLKDGFFAVFALGLATFLYLTVSLRRKRQAESAERARQAMADAKRRLQNKLQLLFADEPRIRSHLAMDEMALRDFLQGIGYVANLEGDPERFTASCKTFKPNLIVSDFAFLGEVEKLVETDALLINTPVVYLRCGEAPATPPGRVRAFLEPNATEKDLTETLSACLKRSPEKIRYSVKPVALKGAIHAGTLMELLHFLAAVKKTGQLIAASGGSKGEIVLRDGDVSIGTWKELTGARAVEAILNLTGGAFEFHERNPDGPAPASALSTQKLLMDWAKANDESNHHSRA
jgi:hypothetical protein